MLKKSCYASSRTMNNMKLLQYIFTSTFKKILRREYFNKIVFYFMFNKSSSYIKYKSFNIITINLIVIYRCEMLTGTDPIGNVCGLSK